MIVLMTGYSDRIKGYSEKKKKDYDFYNLPCVWEDARMSGFSVDNVYCDPKIFDKYVQPYIDITNRFPVIARIDYDNKGNLLRIDFTDTTVEDVKTFFEGS